MRQVDCYTASDSQGASVVNMVAGPAFCSKWSHGERCLISGWVPSAGPNMHLQVVVMKSWGEFSLCIGLYLKNHMEREACRSSLERCIHEWLVFVL